MEIMVFGQIYIKRVSEESIDLSEDNDNEESNLFQSLLGDLKFEDPMTQAALVFFTGKLDDGTIGCQDFWLSNYENGIIKMSYNNGCSDGIIGCERTFNDIQRINEEYIPLLEYLNTAEYIGRYFKLNKPLTKREYMEWGSDDLTPLVLYMDGNRALEYFSDRKYAMITPRFLEAGTYELFGNVNEEYRNTSKVYLDIFNQISDNQRRRN